MMAFGNRTLKFDTLALANPTADLSIAQQEVSASNLNIDPAVVKTGTLEIISSNNLGNDNIELFEPINTGDIVVGEPSDTESPLDESPTDDSGEVEEPLADSQTETETETETEQTEPEYQPEKDAKTNISGGTTEIGFPAWFENSLKKGGMIAGLGVLGFIGYKVADATGVIDKITEKKPAAKPTQKKDEMNAETFEAGSGLGFTINPASIGKGLPTFWAFDVYNDQVNYQTCLTCTQPIDYEIDEDDDFSGVQCKSCESKYEYRDIDNGITDWEKVGYYLIKDAETFEAKVYDPMMQKKIDQNGCEHRYDDGKDAWVLKDADLMGVEDGLSYIEAGVKCGICGQERIGSWAINEKEGFQITKGEEGRMPRFYGFYATENFEAPFGRMPAWKRGQRMWNENHLVWASDSKAVREAIKTAFPEQKFSVRIVNGQYIEVVAKSGTRPADIEQFMRDVKGVAMEELRKIYKDSPEELREKNVEVQAYESVFDAETFEAKSKGKSKCSKCYWDLAVRRNPISGERQFFNQCLLCGKKDFSRGGSAMSDRGFFAEDMPFGVHVKNHKTTSTVFYRRKPFRRFRGNRHKEKAESYAQFMENKLKSNPNRFSYTAEEEDEDDGMMIKEVRLRIDEEGTQFTPTWAIENKIPILYHYDDSSDLEGIIEDMAENAENYAIDHNENYRYGAESFNAEYPQFRNYKGALIERTAKNRAELYSDGWDMTATLYKPRKKGNWILQLSNSHPELGDRYKTEVKNFTDGLNLYIKLSDLSKYRAETKRKE